MARKSRRRGPQKNRSPKPASSRLTAPRRRWWLAGVVVLVLAVGGVTGSFLLRGSDERPASDGAASEPAGIADVRSRVVLGTDNDARPDSKAAQTTTALTNFSAKWQQMDNPQADGWATEVLQQRAKSQLKALGKLIIHPENMDAAKLASLVVSENFRCDRFVPESLAPVFEEGAVVVERSAVGGGGSVKLSGIAGLSEALRETAAEIAGAEDGRFEFKIVGVEQAGEGFTTRQDLSLSGVTDRGVIEHHATWLVDWRLGAEDVVPRMRRIEIENFERVSTRMPVFADCTEAALIQNSCYAQHILRGANHWFDRLPARATGNVFGMPGIAVGDVNGDGLDDLYLCQDPGLPNKLFLQDPDGTLRDVAREWEVNWLEDSRSALLVDLDNDGDQDLVVAIFGNVVLARNEGRRFEIQHVHPCTGSTTSLAAVDYDQDGRLDLYVCGYDQPSGLTGEPSTVAAGRHVLYDAQTGAANKLFRNETTGAEWNFIDVTRQLGLDDDNHRWSFAAAWEDFDNDGDPDLCVANDYGPNNLYQHNQVDGQSKFADVAAEAAADDVAFGMSASWGDYDRDGWMDLYIANMFSSAGHRVTSQTQFKPEVSASVRETFKRMARGNSLLRNHGLVSGSPSNVGVSFRDQSTVAGVTMGRWAWGSNFVDLNNDGWEDLVIANGYVTGEDSADL